MSDQQIPQEHMEDPKYGYVINGGFLLSKWVRENVPHPEPKYKVGDLVELRMEGEITRVYRDCDGTPLYDIDGVVSGYSEFSIYPIDEDTTS